MIDAIEGTQGCSEPRLSSVLAQVTSRRVFDGLNDESASPWAAVSLAAALFVSCFHTGGIRRLISFRDWWWEADLSTSNRAEPRHFPYAKCPLQSRSSRLHQAFVTLLLLTVPIGSGQSNFCGEGRLTPGVPPQRLINTVPITEMRRATKQP